MTNRDRRLLNLAEVLFEQAHDAILLEDANERILDVNARACEMFGYTREQLLQMRSRDLQPSGKNRSPLPVYQEPHKTYAPTELRGLHRDGTIFWLEVNIVPLTGEGEPLFLTFIRDVTERRRSRDRLLALSQVIANSPVVGFVLLAQPGLPVEFVSENVTQYGYTDADFYTGKLGFLDLVHPDDRAELERLTMEKMAGDEDEYEHEVRLCMADGAIRWVQNHIRLQRNNEGKVTQLQGILLDVTGQRLAEAERAVLLDETQMLYEVGQKIALATDMQTVVDLIMTSVPSPGINRAVLFVHNYSENGQPQSVRVAANWYSGTGNPPMATGMVYPWETHTRLGFADVREPLFFEDVLEDVRASEETRQTATRWHVRALVILPLWSGARALGMLLLQGDGAYHFTREVRLLRSLSGLIAGAFANQLLVQQMRGQLSDLAMVQQILSALNQVLTFDDAVEVLLSYISEAVKAARVSMFFREGDAFIRRIGTYPKMDAAPVMGELFSLSDYPTTRLAMELQETLAFAADDPRLEEHERRAFAASGISANAAVPLVGREGVQGVLSVSLRPPHYMFSEQSLRVLKTLADQAMIAFDNIRLLQQTLALQHRQAAVVDIAGTMMGQGALNVLLQTATEGLVKRWNAALVRIWLLEEQNEGAILVLQASAGLSRRLDGQHARKPLTVRSKISAVAIERQARLVNGLIGDRDFLDQEWVKREKLLSFAGYPLVYGEHLLGVIGLFSCQPMSPAEFDILRSFSTQISAAIENNRLLEQARLWAQQQQALREIAAIVSTRKSFEDLMDGLAEIVAPFRKLVDAEGLVLTVYQPGDNDLTVLALATQSEQHHFMQAGMRIPLEGSGPGWVVRNRRPWLDVDLRTSQSFAEDSQLVSEGVISRLLLPLWFGEEVVGTLNIASPRVGAFKTEHIPLLREVADQIALAIDRVRLLERMQEAYDEAAATHRSYLRRAWQDYLLEDRRLRQNTLVYERKEVRFDPEMWRPEMQQALQDAPTQSADVKSAEPQEGRTGVAIPIVVRGQTLGVLGVEDPQGEWHWSPEQLALMQAVVQQLGQALENARLLEASQRRASREQRIAEITDKMRRSLDMEGLIQTTIREMAATLNAPGAFLQLSTGNATTSGGDPQKSPEPPTEGKK